MVSLQCFIKIFSEKLIEPRLQIAMLNLSFGLAKRHLAQSFGYSQSSWSELFIIFWAAGICPSYQISCYWIWFKFEISWNFCTTNSALLASSREHQRHNFFVSHCPSGLDCSAGTKCPLCHSWWWRDGYLSVPSGRIFVLQNSSS